MFGVRKCCLSNFYALYLGVSRSSLIKIIRNFYTNNLGEKRLLDELIKDKIIKIDSKVNLNLPVQIKRRRKKR